MSPVVLVTGGSSGIGKATAQSLLDAGCKVYTCSRRSENPGFDHFPVDVTREEQVQAFVDGVMSREGRVDIVVNAAGFGISGAVEFTETEQARRLMDVNFFGMVAMNRAVLPIMHRQGSGRIINISSVAGAIPIPFQTYYSASKAAIESYSMALANEVRPYGITVCAIQPGDIATGFTEARKKSEEGDDLYGGRISRSVQGMERDEKNGMDPAAVGAQIAEIALHPDHKVKRAVGAKYKLFVRLSKVLPTTTVNYFVGKLYAK